MTDTAMAHSHNGDAGNGVLQVGVVVSGSRTVRFIAAAQERAVLDERLAGYVARNTSIQLFPEDAQRVQELLEERDYSAAVELYFSAVGRRWDPEWLSIRTVQVADAMADHHRVSPRNAHGGRSTSFLGVL